MRHALARRGNCEPPGDPALFSGTEFQESVSNVCCHFPNTDNTKCARATHIEGVYHVNYTPEAASHKEPNLRG